MNDLSTTAERIAKLQGHFFRHERFAPLEQRLTFLMEKRIADIRSGRVREAHGIALLGASGTGKSWAIEQLIQRAQIRFREVELPDCAIISLRVPSPATLKFVGYMVLRELGYHLSVERQAWYIWDIVRHQLRERRVLFLHLDEAQDLSSRGTKHQLNSVASMLKTLMTDDGWPVGILLSGTPELGDILNHDPQLARRMDTIRFDPLSVSANTHDVRALVSAYARRADLALHDNADDLMLAERLIHAAAFQFGLTIEITIAAIEVAYLSNSVVLSREHFAKSFENRTACPDSYNPFIADDYYKLDARRVFGRPEASS
jgi:hypothetical protein